jgi:hypothetical protein
MHPSLAMPWSFFPLFDKVVISLCHHYLPISEGSAKFLVHAAAHTSIWHRPLDRSWTNLRPLQRSICRIVWNSSVPEPRVCLPACLRRIPLVMNGLRCRMEVVLVTSELHGRDPFFGDFRSHPPSDRPAWNDCPSRRKRSAIRFFLKAGSQSTALSNNVLGIDLKVGGESASRKGGRLLQRSHVSAGLQAVGNIAMLQRLGQCPVIPQDDAGTRAGFK